MIDYLQKNFLIIQFIKKFSVQETKTLSKSSSHKAGSSWIQPPDNTFHLQTFDKSTALSSGRVKSLCFSDFKRMLVLKSLIERHGLKKRNVSADEVDGFSYTLM